MIRVPSAIAGHSTRAKNAEDLSRSLGLDKRIHDEKQKLIALTNPEQYISTRLAAEESVKGIAYQTYNSLYDRYESLSLPKEMCDLRARRGAAAIAQVEMAAIEEQYPSISAKSIVTADSGKALRATRKARRNVSETKEAVDNLLAF
jgi:uncharacterized protein YeeX (DUF496 family)